jgi:hypothetical protein
MDNNDCPVCYEKLVEGDENCAMSGINCEHTLCIPCFCKISESDNKTCPICRAKLEEENDSDDETENIFTGSNTRPTTDLFLGRRWLNTETNKIEYFYCFINENGLYNAWVDVEKKNFNSFIQRYLNSGNIDGCCYICGIQRTAEVNEFMKIKYPNGFVNPEGDEWDDYFLDSSWHNNCYECSNMYHKLNHTFYN